MYKYLLSPKKLLAVLVLVVVIVSIYIYKTIGKEAETVLVNPSQVQSCEGCIYFLDVDVDTIYPHTTTIKKYENGQIYNVIPWLPESFFDQQYILGFDVINEDKFIIFTEKEPKQTMGAQDFLGREKYECSFYLLDGNTKKANLITSMEGANLPSRGSLAVVEDNNICLAFNGELIKITPEGKRIVLTNMEMLPSSISKDATSFNQVSVGPNNIFAILEKEKYQENIIVEMDRGGKFVKSYDLFGDSGDELSFIGYCDDALFIRNGFILYRYDLKTELLEKVFDEPLDDIHHWLVFDLAKTNDGYLLLVTDSESSITTHVWKLTDDNLLQKNFLTTTGYD